MPASTHISLYSIWFLHPGNSAFHNQALSILMELELALELQEGAGFHLWVSKVLHEPEWAKLV